MPLARLSKSLVLDPLLTRLEKSLYPAGLGAGTRGGHPLATSGGNMRYQQPKTVTASRPMVATRGSSDEWHHAIRSVMPDASSNHVAQTAQTASGIFGKHIAAHEFLRGFHVDHGDYRSRVNDVGRGYDRSGKLSGLRVKGQVVHKPTGNVVGSFWRQFQPGEHGPVAVNHWFALHPNHRGAGFGTHFYQQTEHHYRVAGIKEVRLRADIREGPYVWAMHGYDFHRPAERTKMIGQFNRYLNSVGAKPFSRHLGFPLHSRKHPLHPWEIAVHGDKGRRLGKEFLTSHPDLWDKEYTGIKRLEPGQEGYQVGLAYQRSHMARRQNLNRTFSKSEVNEPPPPMPPEDWDGPEGMERTMERWHDDAEGEGMAHEAVRRVIERHHAPDLPVRAEAADDVKPIEKAHIWRANGEWFVNEQWLLQKALPMGPGARTPSVRPVASPSAMAGKMKSPMPHLSASGGPPKINRPTMPKQAGVTLSGKQVPRTADGRIDYGSVSPGAAFWVTIHDPESPLEGRAVRIVKRGNGMFAAAGGSQVFGKIRSTENMGGEIERRGRMLSEGLRGPKVSLEHLKTGTSEVADIRKMSSKDIRSAAATHSEVSAPKQETPEEKASREKRWMTAQNPLARDKRMRYNRTKRRAAKEEKRLQMRAYKALGIEYDDKGQPTHLTREQLVDRRDKIKNYFNSARFKKLNPDTQTLVAHTLNNAVTNLDNTLRDQEKRAAEAHIRQVGGKWDSDIPLPVDIGLGGVDPGDKPVVTHDGVKKTPGRRALVIAKSKVDQITDIGADLDKGTISPEQAETMIRDVVEGELQKNVDAAHADESDSPTDEQKAAKDELSKEAKKDGALLIQQGKPRKSIRKQIIANPKALTSRYAQDLMERLDLVRQGQANAGTEAKATGDAFMRAVESGDLTEYASAVDQVTNNLEIIMKLVGSDDKGAQDEIRAATRSQMDPATRRFVRDRLGGDYNARTMTNALAVEAQSLKYGALDEFGALDKQNPRTDDKLMPNVFALAATEEGRNELLHLGDAALHMGRYYQTEAIRAFEGVRSNWFKDTKGVDMRGFVRLYGMKVTANLFAYQLWKNHVLNIPDEEAEAALTDKDYFAGVRKPKLAKEQAIDRAKRRMASDRERYYSRAIQALENQNAMTFPVTERNALRVEGQIQDQWDALQDTIKAANKRGEPIDEHEAATAAELVAKGCQNLGGALGSMQAQAELATAMRNVTSEMRMKNIPLETRYGNNKELAESAGRKIFGASYEQHLHNAGTEQSPVWTLRGSVGDWTRKGLPAIQAQRDEEVDRARLRHSDEGTEIDEGGNVWAKPDSLPEWIRPGGEFIKKDWEDHEDLDEAGNPKTKPVRIKGDQRNAMNVLEKYPTGVLDHTTGYGKSFITMLHGLNMIGKAKASKKQHRMLVVHTHSDVWGEGKQSAWKKFVQDDAPIYTTNRREREKTLEKLAALTKNGSGIMTIHHRDLSDARLREAVQKAGFHSVVLDEPQTPGFTLTKKGNYTALANWLYGKRDNKSRFSGGVIGPDGAHGILSSATVANATSPRAVYNQLEPILQRAGSSLGSRRYWVDTTGGLGRTTSAASAAINGYVRNALGPYQVSDPHQRYPYNITHRKHEHIPMTQEQQDEAAYWSRPQALNELRDNDLLKPPPGYRLKEGEKLGGAIEVDPTLGAAAKKAIKESAEDIARLGHRTKGSYDRMAKLFRDSRDSGRPDQEQKAAEWRATLSRRKMDRINESLYAMPRSVWKRHQVAGGEAVGRLRHVAPLLHDTISRIKAGEKSVVFSYGSPYQAGVIADALRSQLATLHGKGERGARVIVADFSERGPGEREAAIDKAIERFKTAGDPSEVIIFTKPLSGKNIGNAHRAILAGVPRDDSGMPDAAGLLQSVGRATRERQGRPLDVDRMIPNWTPEMRDHTVLSDDIDSMLPINPAIHSALGGFIKSLSQYRHFGPVARPVWLKVNRPNPLTDVHFMTLRMTNA